MNIELKTTTAILGPMTIVERQRGRYMRAPDGHDGGGGSGVDGDSSSSDDSATGDNGDKVLSTADQLDKEFGEQSSSDGDDGADEDDDGQEDLGSNASDDDEGDGSDGEDEGDEGEDDADDQEDGKPKNRTAERIAEFQNATREAQAKAATATREAEKWKRIAEAAPQAAEASGDGESDPNAEPDPANFEFGAADPEFIAAKAEWGAVNRLRKEGEAASLKAEINSLEAKYQGGVPAAMEKYPDYDLIVTKGSEGETPAWVCPPIIALAIRSSDVGHDVAYHLAKNPTEASRIAGLNNYEQVREFGRLEGRFMYEAEKAAVKDDNKGGGNNAPASPKKRTNAPKPPAHNLARGAGGKFSVPPDTNDFAAFDKAYGNGPKKR